MTTVVAPQKTAAQTNIESPISICLEGNVKDSPKATTIPKNARPRPTN